jgi:hypothetical protein
MKPWLPFSKDRATPKYLKILLYFNILWEGWASGGGLAAAAFSARRQDLPSIAGPKPVRLIASREYGLY